MELSLFEIALRLSAAAGFGALLGINRDLERKPLGVRTLALVALASAVVAVTAVTVPGLYNDKDALSRVVQGVLQGVLPGIGFIGAGVLLVRPEAGAVKGLTTAAVVWVAAVLGICCGLAQWTVALTACTLALTFLVGLKWFFDRAGWDID